MRPKFEVEVETAASILKAMGNTMDQMERWWPASRRGSNGQRELDQVRSQRAAALQCLIDARAALSKDTPDV